LVQATKINKKMGYGVSVITYRKLSRWFCNYETEKKGEW
jgi:hypothetical protein